jgi:hypothetical protein
MNTNNASLRDAGVDDPDTPAIGHSELRWLISDFESLVTAGLLHGTRQEAAHFFSGWLAFEDHGRASPDSLRLIVLPGLAKDDG